ncbi:GNAT family N-acetyltransferase [bacterium]|nr:GNAT family N-acetyltransferase [bacterium]
MGLLINLRRPHLDDLPPVRIPAGYRLATASEFDNPCPTWAGVINACFEDQHWTEEYIRESFMAKPQYDSEGVFFIMCGEEAVATAFTWRDEPDETREGRIRWVATLAEHRGRGLGKAIVLATMHYFRDRGFEAVHLGTLPPLLPAIRMYLGLGMQPVLGEPEHDAAWRGVFQALARPWPPAQ